MLYRMSRTEYKQWVSDRATDVATLHKNQRPVCPDDAELIGLDEQERSKALRADAAAMSQRLTNCLGLEAKDYVGVRDVIRARARLQSGGKSIDLVTPSGAVIEEIRPESKGNNGWAHK